MPGAGGTFWLSDTEMAVWKIVKVVPRNEGIYGKFENFSLSCKRLRRVGGGEKISKDGAPVVVSQGGSCDSMSRPEACSTGTKKKGEMRACSPHGVTAIVRFVRCRRSTDFIRVSRWCALRIRRNWSEWVVWKVILGKLPCHLHADHYDGPRDLELEELDPESRQGKSKKVFWTLSKWGWRE